MLRLLNSSKWSLLLVNKVGLSNEIIKIHPILPVISNSIRLFHQSSILYDGRKTGSKALQPKPREPSKKQLKRFHEKQLKWAEKRNPIQENIQEKMLTKQIQSPEISSLFKNTEKDLNAILDSLKFPSSEEDFNKIDDKKNKILEVDANSIMLNLKILKSQSFSSDRKNNDTMTEKSMPKSSSSLSLSTHPEYSNQGNNQLPTFTESQIAEIKDPDRVNLALQKFATEKSMEQLYTTFRLMRDFKIELTPSSYTAMINVSLDQINYKRAEQFVRELTLSKLQPDINGWNAIIRYHSESGSPKRSIHIIDTILRRSGIPPTTEMFNSILKAFVKKNMKEEVENIWIRMHLEGVKFNLESFHSILRYCAQTSQSEKAFFYFDELKHKNIVPTVETFVHLIRACAEAPHWINGYQDIIFDAISTLEGSELKPTVEVYNAIIHAFGKAGDATASEFYFWEMKRKGLVPDVETYNSLLYAYAKNCSVGLKYYGRKGRYVKPLERKYTAEEQDLADIGPERAFEFLSKEFSRDETIERGSRQYSKIENLKSNPEYSKIIRGQIHEEAVRVRATRKLEELEAKQLLEKKLLSKLRQNSEQQFNYLDDNNSNNNSNNNNITNRTDEDDEMASLLSGLTVDKGGVTMKDGSSIRLNEEEMILFKQLQRMFNSKNETTDLNSDRINQVEDGKIKNIKMTELNNKEDIDNENSNKDITEPRIGRRRTPMVKRPQKHNNEKLTEAQYQSEPQSKVVMEEDEILNRMVISSTKSTNFVNVNSMKKEKVTEKETEKKQGDSNNDDNDMVLSNKINEKDRKFLEQSSKLIEITDDDILRSKETEPKNYSHLFQNKYPVNIALRESQKIMRLATEFTDPFIGNIPIASPSSLGSSTARKDRERLENNALLRLLDNRSISKKYNVTKNDFKDLELESEKNKSSSSLSSISNSLEEEWDMIEFGRAPDPDYTLSLPFRQRMFIQRARLVFNEIKKNRLRLTIYTMNSYLLVYTESSYVKEALRVFHLFKTYKVTPNEYTYRAMIRMYVREKDIKSAFDVKNDALFHNVIPDASSYGIMIQSCVQRNDIEQALKLFEEATRYNLKIPDYSIRFLQGRCNTLKITHPDLPESSLKWVKEVKEIRRNQKYAPKSKIQDIRSLIL